MKHTVLSQMRRLEHLMGVSGSEMGESVSVGTWTSRSRNGLHANRHWARLGGLGSSRRRNTGMDLLHHASARCLSSEMRGSRMLAGGHWVILHHARMVRHADLRSRERLRHHHFRLTTTPGRPSRTVRAPEKHATEAGSADIRRVSTR